MLAALLLALPVVAAAPQEESAFKPVGRWALVVGISDYDFIPDLTFARQDAKAFAEALVEDQGFAADAVRLMTDDAEDPYARPTNEYVLRTLRQMLADPRRSPSDLFVFYFSGHGVGTKGGDYLLPRGADISTAADVGLEVKEIVELLREAGARNTLFVMDACREGEERTPFGRWLIDLPDDQRVAVLLSCEPGSRSLQSRRLGHGLFTYYLLEGMSSDEVADDASGAIWASRLGEWVKEQVEEHTSLDDPPQVPRVTIDQTRDLLVGAKVVPEALEGTELAAHFQSFADKGLGPEAYLDAIGHWALVLSRAGYAASVVDVTESLAQRVELPPVLLYIRSSALGSLGRSVEARRAIRDLQSKFPTDYYALAAVVEDPSRSVSDEERGLAALKLVESHSPLPPETVPPIVHCLLLGLDPEAALETLDTLAAAYPDTTREHWYIVANRSRALGELERMVDAYTRAYASPGAISDTDLVSEYAIMLERIRRYDRALEILSEAVEVATNPGPWLARRAELLRKLRETEAAKRDALESLKYPLVPKALLQVVAVLGANVKDEGTPELVVARAKLHPLAWEARIAEVIATTPGDELAQKFDELVHLSSSPAQFVSGMADALLIVCEDLVAQGRMTEAELHEFYWNCVTIMAPLAGEFGLDEAPWQTLERVTVDAGGFVELRALLDRHLAPYVEARTLPASLGAIYATACLNTGDVARLRELQPLLGEGTQLTANFAMFEAAFLASYGDVEEARGALQKVVDAKIPSDSFAHSVSQIAALIEARSGNLERALELLEGASAGFRFSDAVAAHAFVLLGAAEPARPILEGIAGRTGGIFAFVEHGALRALVAAMDDDAQRLAFAHRCACELAGNPLARGVSFAEVPGVASFAGIQRFALGEADEESKGQLFLFVQPDGKAEGQVSYGGDLNGIVSGTVDEYGNLTATLRGTGEGGGTSELRMKLPTKEAVEAYEPLRSLGVYLVWIPESGLVRRVRAFRQD